MMHNYEHVPFACCVPRKQPRSLRHSLPMSRPVSKTFNRISDFIFPDTVHIHLSPHCHHHHHHQKPAPYMEPYRRADNFTVPIYNRRDVVVVERLPAEEFDDIDLLYREQQNRPVQRRFSSIADDRRIPPNGKQTTGLKNRSAASREKVRDRRKRHTTDNVYHSMLKSCIERDQQKSSDDKNSNCILSYKTTLDPITDSESITSVNQERYVKGYNNPILRYRVPINGAIPSMSERVRLRQLSSTVSTGDSSSDSEIIQQRPTTINSTHYRQDSSYTNSSNIHRNTRKHRTRQSNHFANGTSNIDRNDSTPRVSVCVNDLRTTLYIDEDSLDKSKHIINNSDKKAHIRKRNTLVDGSILTADYSDDRETIKSTKVNSFTTVANENKTVRPYFLIKPQTVLVLPNETAKFKCCFGGDPIPNLIWSHNNFCIPDNETKNSSTLSRYQTHTLHDINYLDIGPVNLLDHGQIKCSISNTFGREEVVAQLIVVRSPADATPSISQSLSDVTITEGQPLELSCCINGLQVMVNWFHNGKLVSTTNHSKSDYNNETSTFALSNCMRTDAGTIDCIVKNRFGEVRTSCRIEVVNDPEFDR